MIIGNKILIDIYIPMDILRINIDFSFVEQKVNVNHSGYNFLNGELTKTV
jgi:hypothetical protein